MESLFCQTTRNGVGKALVRVFFLMQEAFADLAGMAKKKDFEASQLAL